MTNKELLLRFEQEHMAPNSVTPQRRKEQLALLGSFAEEVLNDRPLVEMQPGEVMEWMGAEIDRGLHPNTVRTKHGMIRAFHTWAFRAGLIDAELRLRLKAVPNPRGSSAQSTPKPYTPSEIRTFYRELAERYPSPPLSGKGSRKLKRFDEGKTPIQRGIWLWARRYQLEAQVSLALEEGLRCIEICHITMAQIHPDNDGVIVVTAKQGPGTAKEREVPYMAHSRLAVAEWLEFRERLGVTHNRPWLRLYPPDYLTPMTLDQMHNGISLSGKVWNWHPFRHTYATESLRAGMPLEHLQITMGHGSIDQTLAYARIAKADIQRVGEQTEGAFAERLGLVA
jgi:integrase